MPKSKVKKAIDKASEGMTFVKEGLDTVRSKPWAEPVGTALGVTASICRGLGDFVPGLGIVGGAINIGAKMLNPAPTLADIKRTEQEVISQLEGQTGMIKELLEHKLETLREEMKRPHSEILEDFDIVKKEVQSSASAMTQHMNAIGEELVDMKNIINHTYQLVRDTRYRDGIEKIEGAYETFINGLNNLEDTLKDLRGYMFELQVHCNQNLKPQRIREYLRAILLTEEIAMAQQIFKYILVVRSMYLQVVCAYYVYQEDPDRVGREFELFNEDFKELCIVFESETGTEFKPEQPLTEDLIEKCLNSKKEMPDITQTQQNASSTSDSQSIEEFLDKIDLNKLTDIFKEEEVTMDMLKTFTDDDLKSIGVTKFGQRRKILNAISNLGYPGQKDLEVIQSPPPITPTDVQLSAPPMPEGQSDAKQPPTYSEANCPAKGIKGY